ncbi:RNA polymerase sigma factor [Ideonella sp.]|uniref:RNA polymerase sigma factor n=1 Tax=Ideonella sp. TaxID=1929293 RepID=UPI0035B2F871
MLLDTRAAPPTAAPTPVSDAARRDDDLVAHLAAGRPDTAFDLLVARYAAKVHRLCLALLREPARAEDAAQDCLLRAWRGLAGYRPAAGAVSTWLYALTRHHCLNLLERAPPPAASLSDEAVADVVAGLAAPEHGGPAADGQALLRRWVDALPAAQRSALTLYYYEDRAVNEVAAMLGMPEATVKTHLHRGRARLRQQLADAGLADPALWL